MRERERLLFSHKHCIYTLVKKQHYHKMVQELLVVTQPAQNKSSFNSLQVNFLEKKNSNQTSVALCFYIDINVHFTVKELPVLCLLP